MRMDSKRTQSFEDYLERIIMIEEEKGKVRSIDIANKLNFTRSSISIAIKKMEQEGLIVVDKGTYLITPTEKGREIGEKIYAKHKIIKHFFESIGVSSDDAEHDACLMEHDLSDESYKKFVEFIEKNEQQ